MAAIFGQKTNFLRSISKEILCFCIFDENSNFKMAAIFGQKKIFGKLGRVYALCT